MPHHFVVVDLGYGDAGKGTTVDYLCRRYPITGVVRFNGGPQAAHHVVRRSRIGRWHCFSTWGSGTFSAVPTYLGPRVLINPLNAQEEAQGLVRHGVVNPWTLLHIHDWCPVITPWHVVENRVLETMRGADRHGSCGQGIGTTMQDQLNGFVLRYHDLQSRQRAKNLLTFLRDMIRDRIAASAPRDLLPAAMFESGYLAGLMDDYEWFYERTQGWLSPERDLPGGSYVFEGAQGILIDENFGTMPYVTWSTCTDANANKLLRSMSGEVTRLGVTRTYMVRHGPGPMPTESARLTIRLPEIHNGAGPWQGPVRKGELDVEALGYAIDCCEEPVDGLVLTHLDQYLPGPYTTERDVYEWLKEELGVPVRIASFGPTYTDKVTVEEFAHA